MNPESIRTMICAWPTCTERIEPGNDGYHHVNHMRDLEVGGNLPHPACRDSLQVARFMAAQRYLSEVIVEHRQFTQREWRKALELALSPEHSDLFDRDGNATES